MIEPSIDKMINLVDSKYTLVVLAAKRARGMVANENSTEGSKSGKPVTAALYEVASKKITYRRNKTGIK